MNLSLTFSLYLCRKFLIATGIILLIVSCAILLSSTVEVARTISGKDIGIGIISQLVILKYPFLLQKTIPFLILLGTIFCFANLTKTSELIIARSIGISVWQFLLPPLVCSFIIGLFMIMVFNPLSSALLNKQERIAHKYLKGAASVLTVSNSGLWLKEKMGEGNIIIHAKSIYNKEMKLFDVSFFRLDYNNNFINRIDAKTATLKPGFWLLDSAFILSTSKFAEFHNNYEIPTNLAITKLQDSFASPETISFWEMPSFINTLKAAGFSAIRHSLYYYSLLIQPFFICSMVFIAASFSLHLPRHGKSNLYIVSGIFVGFVIYFFAYLVFALGLSGNIPVFLATIAPVAISMLIGISMLLHLEDG